MNIYVGNLSWETTEDELRQLFEAYGQVSSASIIKDKYSGRSRGFAFVEMPTDSEGQDAIAQLNESDFGGRPLKVNVAKPQEDRGSRRSDRGRRKNYGSGGSNW